MLSPIWSISLLLAMLPTDQPLQQGPDAPHLDRGVAAQQALSQTARAVAFRARWGPLSVRWDPRNGTPRALVGTGLPGSAAPQLVADLARLGGVDPRSLVLSRVTEGASGDAWVYEQQHRGAPIEGGGVVVHVRQGRIVLVLASLHLPKETGDPRPGEVLLPDHAARPLAYRWTSRAETADTVSFTDREGRAVHGWTTRYPLELETEARTVGDPLIAVPARQVTVRDETGETRTDDGGDHGLVGALQVDLEGPFLQVRHDQTPITDVPVSDDLLVWDVDLVPAATTVQHHFHVAWDWLGDRRPSHTWLDRQVVASVLVPGSCNAYYTNGTINFYGAEEGRCADFGRIADVVYHELGHGFHHYVIDEGTFAGDVSEGSADYVSATLLDDPVLAPEAIGPGTYIRELDTDRRYPDDATGESHNDGLIWGSFLWNLRQAWSDTYGVDDGVRRADALFLETLSFGPTLTDMTEAVIAADDDDGDLSNGTPHACELIELLNQHGLGPGSLGLVQLDHESLQAQGSQTLGYPVDFSLIELTAECGELDPDSVRVVYGVDLPQGGAPFDPSELLELVPTRSGEHYTAVLPRQLPGTHVVYGMRWSSADGETTVDSFDGRLDGLHGFFVGDRQALWCADFEHDWDGLRTAPRVYGEPPGADWVDEWERTAPLGQDWNPTGAWAGSTVVGTALSGDGLYAAHNGQRALTADLRLTEADPRLALLTARRWLTVEDGKYDQAQVWAEGDNVQALLWRNPSTSSGTRPEIDVDWTLFDVDLRSLLDAQEDLRFAFTLATDGGLEYGGWALDELCVVTLADVPGHYRVRDLAASDDAETVTITWTQPMITPLSATVLVRKRDSAPAHASDGLIVDLDTDPVPGGAREVVDAEVLPGERFHYAVFAAPTELDTLDDVVPGENSDEGGVPGPFDTGDSGGPTETGGPVDTAPSGGTDGDTGGAPVGEEGDGTGACGCATVPGGGAAVWWLGLIGVWRRRR